MVATYEIFAIRYAHLERTARDNFLGGDEHDGPMPLDYYVWAIVNAERTVLVDTGFDQATADRRGRTIVRPVADGLGAIGISPDRVEHIVISHMHYDHAGNHELFPRARYHLQDEEMAYCTGRCMAEPQVGGVFDAAAVTSMVHKVYAGRVQFHDGDEELAPGISLHKVGGHTRGMQVVRVATARGWVVLGSDTAHFYANLEPGRPVSDPGQSARLRRGAAHRTAAGEFAGALCPGPRSAGTGPLSGGANRTRRASPGSISRPACRVLPHDARIRPGCPEPLGFIGLGRMGGAMAERLLAAGHPVTVYDPDPAALRRCCPPARSAADSPAAVASVARIVFASLPTPTVVLEVVRGVRGVCHGTAARIFVDLSTSGASAAIAIDQCLRDARLWRPSTPRSAAAWPAPGPEPLRSWRRGPAPPTTRSSRC